uniref:Uncharacterized protein n=1 Tax=Tanacetum cinerariifolium TaxID=118510 RepID=A0A6L2LL57_TANCI|nr:hypothetical protein [Tanacetum cinerariifolium]
MPNVAMNGTNDKIGGNDYEDSNVKSVDDEVLSDSCNSGNKESNENNNDVKHDVLSSDCNNGCEEIREKSNNLDNNEPDAAGKGDGRDRSQMKNSKAEKNYSYVNASLAKNNDGRKRFKDIVDMNNGVFFIKFYNEEGVGIVKYARVLVEVPVNKCVPDKIEVVYREKDKVKVDYEEANTVDLEKTNSQDKKMDSERGRVRNDGFIEVKHKKDHGIIKK